MCIYTVKTQILKKKNSSRGVRDSTWRPKLGVSGVKDTAKTCYIQVELLSEIFLKYKKKYIYILLVFFKYF